MVTLSRTRYKCVEEYVYITCPCYVSLWKHFIVIISWYNRIYTEAQSVSKT
jgi:predicted metal-binding protein